MADEEAYHVPDVVEKALLDDLRQFRNSINMRNVTVVLLQKVQELEDVVYSLNVDRRLDTASGVHLDVYGKLVGEERRGLSDAEYRKFIKARIQTNLSEGEIDRILFILETITGADSVEYFPGYPASFIVQFAVDSVPLNNTLADRISVQITEATGAGIGAQVVEYKTVGAFGFDGDDEALGFGEGVWARTI